MLELKNYQLDAVNKLYQYTLESFNILMNKNALLSMLDSQVQVLFKAPTAAGKTIMMADYIEKLVTLDNEINAAIVWVSIGKGGLHLQSKEKIQRCTSAVNCYTNDDVADGTITRLNRGDALFLSWDMMNNKNSKGEWTNIIMRDGESYNIPKLLDNTSFNGVKIIMIIDESHTSASSNRAIELLKMFSPKLIVNVTATPKDGKYDYVINVSAKDVIKEGMIKRCIEINSDMELRVSSDGELLKQNGAKADIITSLLASAIKKQKELIKYYKAEGVKINPLILIQIPDSVEGQTYLETIESELEKYNISYENNSLAVWLSDSSLKKNLDNIELNSAPQRCLVFKTAIDTGWDCPRAQILVKLRMIKSESFKKQIVGRILRMPEHKHYTRCPQLNIAYIYTNEERFRLEDDKDTTDFIKEYAVNQNTVQIKERLSPFTQLVLPSMILPKEVKPQLNMQRISRDFAMALSERWDAMEQVASVIEDSEISLVGHTVVNSEDFDNNHVTSVTDEEGLKLVKDEVLLEYTVKKLINKVIYSPKNSEQLLGFLKSIRNTLFPPKEGVKRGRRKKNYFSDYFKVFECNSDLFVELLQGVIQKSSSWIYPYVDECDIGINYFNIPAEIKFSDVDSITDAFDSKCLYECYEAPKTRAIVKYIEQIDNDSTVVCWYPNWQMTRKQECQVRFAYKKDGVYRYAIPSIVVRKSNINHMIFLVTTSDEYAKYEDIIESIPEEIKSIPAYKLSVEYCTTSNAIKTVSPSSKDNPSSDTGTKKSKKITVVDDFQSGDEFTSLNDLANIMGSLNG